MSEEMGPLPVEAITSAEVARRLGVQLRKMVGPGRRWSYRGVSRLTGIDVRTLQAYATGSACPNLAKFKRLLAVLGPELGRDIDRMYGWVPRDESSRPGALDLPTLRTQLEERLRLIDVLLAADGSRERA